MHALCDHFRIVMHSCIVVQEDNVFNFVSIACIVDLFFLLSNVHYFSFKLCVLFTQFDVFV